MSHQLDIGIEFPAAETETARAERGGCKRVKQLHTLYVKNI